MTNDITLDECKDCPINSKCMCCPVSIQWVKEHREKNQVESEES